MPLLSVDDLKIYLSIKRFMTINSCTMIISSEKSSVLKNRMIPNAGKLHIISFTRKMIFFI
jgi:hypothetical protein